jgi:hypothetical protein
MLISCSILLLGESSRYARSVSGSLTPRNWLRLLVRIRVGVIESATFGLRPTFAVFCWSDPRFVQL